MNSGNTPEAARLIRLLVLDVDGVLTDGSIMLDDDGRETKRFNVRDGLGITCWLRLGFEAAIITRRLGGATLHRMRELGITRVVQGSKDKLEAVKHLSAELSIPLTEIAFIGDDWPDMSAMTSVGLPIAVGDADEAVKQIATERGLTTAATGGRGAVREAIDMMLAAKGLTDKAKALFSAGLAQ